LKGGGGRLLGRLLVGGCWGGCWWAAAVGGCWGGGGQETPEVPVLPVCASVARAVEKGAVQ
jgi:hypothetical protein